MCIWSRILVAMKIAPPIRTLSLLCIKLEGWLKRSWADLNFLNIFLHSLRVIIRWRMRIRSLLTLLCECLGIILITGHLNSRTVVMLVFRIWIISQCIITSFLIPIPFIYLLSSESCDLLQPINIVTWPMGSRFICLF